MAVYLLVLIQIYNLFGIFFGGPSLQMSDESKRSATKCARRMFGLGERRQGEADVFFGFPSRARVRRFSFFSFTSSPVGRNAQYIRA